MQFKSLERSLQIGLVVSLLVLMLLFWWAGSLVSRLLSESLVYSRLEIEATNVVGALEFPDIELDAPRLSNARLHPAYDTPYSGKYYLISLSGESDISSRSLWEQDFRFEQLPPGGQAKGRLTGKADEPVLFWAGGFSVNGHQFTVAVAEDISAINERLNIFQLYFAAISLLLLLTLLIVQHLIVRLSLKKLEKVRGDIHKLEHGQAVALSENVPTEILPLVHEFNRLLLLFDQRLKHSRNSLGNLAHALKGPLNLLLRVTDNTEEQPTEANRIQLRENAEQILQVVESELKRARLAGRGAPGQLFDLKAEIPSLCGLLKQIYSEKDVEIKVDIESGTVLNFDRQDMLELVGNLLDNAVKWAHSTVYFSVSAVSVAGEDVERDHQSDKNTRKAIRFVVEDDGPGCSEEQLDRLTQRGVRIDESVSGHGLGLSIVNDIVGTYSGVLELQRSAKLGGLFAGVFLPVSASMPGTGAYNSKTASKYDQVQGADESDGKVALPTSIRRKSGVGRGERLSTSASNVSKGDGSESGSNDADTDAGRHALSSTNRRGSIED